ncbi:basic proline-rich protein-like [Poecile atricapillus]|uniref:basic proline-rich protein-like n=1 Tax=Poecile atricapillus TaxID=48891 RepID=UPI00273A2BE7|nr:basic proline-rich protein-like [Poecile atricapillus]
MVRTAGRAAPCTAALRSGGRAGAPLPRAARSGAGAAPAQPRREAPPPGSLTCRPRGGGGPGRCGRAAASPRSALGAEPRPLRPLTPPFPAPPAAAPRVPRRHRPRSGHAPGHAPDTPTPVTPQTHPHPATPPPDTPIPGHAPDTPTGALPAPGGSRRPHAPERPGAAGPGRDRPGGSGASEHRVRAGNSRQKRCPARSLRGEVPRAQRGCQGAERGCSVPWSTRPRRAGAGIARTGGPGLGGGPEVALGSEVALARVQCPRVARPSRGGLPAGAGGEPGAIGAAHGSARGDSLWAPGGKLVAAGTWTHSGAWGSRVPEVVGEAETGGGTATCRREGDGAHPAGSGTAALQCGTGSEDVPSAASLPTSQSFRLERPARDTMSREELVARRGEGGVPSLA